MRGGRSISILIHKQMASRFALKSNKKLSGSAQSSSQPKSYFDEEDDDTLNNTLGIEAPIRTIDADDDCDPLDDFMYDLSLYSVMLLLIDCINLSVQVKYPERN